jgi:Flp pilus assembly protein TadB
MERTVKRPESQRRGNDAKWKTMKQRAEEEARMEEAARRRMEEDARRQDEARWRAEEDARRRARGKHLSSFLLFKIFALFAYFVVYLFFCPK